MKLEGVMSLKEKTINDFGTKRIGSFNWLGFRTLYEKEVRRYCKVFGQTVGAPFLTTLIFMMILLWLLVALTDTWAMYPIPYF